MAINNGDHYTRLLAEMAKVSANLESLEAEVGKLSKLLTGNGDPAKGLVVMVDRLTQESERRGNWVKAAISASVVSVVGFVGMLVKMVMK